MNSKRPTAWYITIVIFAGAACLAAAGASMPVAKVDAYLLLLVALTIVFGSRITIQIPRFKSHIAVSDTFIFLTLLLSLQASYAAPLILLAQNRQTDRDRIQINEDRDRTERLIADTEYLAREIAALRIGLGEVVTRDYLRRELRALVDEFERDEDEL